MCKQYGHATRLIGLERHDVAHEITRFEPDVVAYSAMSPDIHAFKQCDQMILRWVNATRRRVLRIMGGPHATFHPDILNEMRLDALCIGEGDYALLRAMEQWEHHEPLTGIPNILPFGGQLDEMKKELVADLDSLPFPDRKCFYDAAPEYRHFQLRSVITGRGCPYRCSYCHNNAYNKMFGGSGKILRRRSVDSVISELKYVREYFAPLGMVRFGNDNFAFKVDDWLVELMDRYKKEINVPFYCLLRPNCMSDEMGKLLADSGCYSVGMSLETGNEEHRQSILKRYVTDETAEAGFAISNKYKIRTIVNSMLALPGTTFKDDYNTFLFEKKVKPTNPTLGIWSPFPGTDITKFAMEIGGLGKDYNFSKYFAERTPLKGYTEKEKDKQINLRNLGPIFCLLPDAFLPLLKFLIERKPNFLFFLAGNLFVLSRRRVVFKPALPKSFLVQLKIYFKSFLYVIESAPSEDMKNK